MNASGAAAELNDGKAKPSRSYRRLHLGIGITVSVAIAFLVTQCAIRPRLDAWRMNTLATTITGAIHPGMTSEQAVRELDRQGIEHSEVISDARNPRLQRSDAGVIYAMIRNRVSFGLVERDIQILVYVDGDQKVTRVEREDVFTGL